MSSYLLPSIAEATPVAKNEILLVASGDLRPSANQTCWPAQAAMEEKLIAAFKQEGFLLRRAHSYREDLGHGFISSQRMGMDVFMTIHPDAPIVVAEAVWQYSHNVLAGLQSHRGPILTVANWSGQWPGLVGMLNLNGSLHKAGVQFSSIWSEEFDDEFFLNAVREWLQTGTITHDASHVLDLDRDLLPQPELQLGAQLAKALLTRKSIIGVFDEGCMGMYNAIIEDSLLNKTGIYKERLSQSALVAAMREVLEDEALRILAWLDESGMTFEIGTNEETELTKHQLREQCRMYIAAVRLADEFGCDAIGIQYQQGLRDMTPASDLVEGLLNNVLRPPVFDKNGQELFAGKALPHFNEVDECAGVDALVTNRVWTAMNLDPSTTLHDVRWGEHYKSNGVDDFVWLFQISGACPASHFTNGYKDAVSVRQPAMYFKLGGGTLKGVCKPGPIVWSRVFVEDGRLHADLGLATVVELPQAEVERRWQLTTSQWPMMNAVLEGVNRDQFMARHRANHINVAYAPSRNDAGKALAAKASMMAEMGILVHLCGNLAISV